jgi:hypothetical protein
MKLLNLDKFINENRIIRIQGIDYNVPGLIPVEKVLTISKMGQDATDRPEVILEVLTEVWNVLAPFNPGKDAVIFRNSISGPMLQELLPFIFNDRGGEDIESGDVDLSKNESGRVEPSKS